VEGRGGVTVLMNQSKKSLLVCIEPWGEQYPLAPGHKLRVKGEGPPGGELEIVWAEDRVTVHGWSGGTIKVEPL
jgi:hypothetical protein